MGVAPPVITAAPAKELVDRAFTNTCGWISGAATADSAIVCSEGMICGALSVGPQEGYANCCTSTSCTFETNCVTTCTDSDCRTNENVLKCTDPAASLCGSFVYQVAPYYTAFFCTESFLETSMPVFDSNAISDFATLYTFTLDSPDQSIFSEGASTTTPGPGPGQTTPPAADHGSSSPPIGAIVGASIGGLVALGLIAGLIIWLCRRQPKSAPTPVLHSQTGNQPLMSQSGGQSQHTSTIGSPPPGTWTGFQGAPPNLQHGGQQGLYTHDDAGTFSSGSQTYVGQNNVAEQQQPYKQEGLAVPNGLGRTESVFSAPFSTVESDNVDPIHGVGFRRG